MGFCSSCGTAVIAESAFCAKCGTAVFASAKSLPEQPSVPITSVKNDEVSKIFVGKNYEYFQRKWEIADQKKGRLSWKSWNWAAFLAGFAWMAYRRMYIYSWVFIGAVIVEILCEYAFGLSDKLSNIINLSIAFSFGRHGNYLYKLHVEKKVKEITMTNTPDQAKSELARQGGTNIGAAIGFVVVLLAIIILVNVVANPEVKQALESLSARAQGVTTQSPPVETQPQAVNTAPASSQVHVYKYEPEVVALQGTLLSAPGDTPDGAKITFPALQLVAPITVQGVPGDALNETEEGVALIQIVLDENMMVVYKNLKGVHVMVTGTLFHQDNGNHHTKILITPKTITPVV